MEIFLYSVFCFIARKKIITNVSYLLGTLMFISLSYNTANQLSKVPERIQLTFARSVKQIRQPSTGHLEHGERVSYLKNQCDDKRDPSPGTVSHLIHRSNILDHLGFVLRSHSLFYCSVPKVATRTLLTYVTYLHLRDELMASLTNTSTSYFNKNSNLFNTDYVNAMLSSSIQNDSLSLLSSLLSRLMKTDKSNSTQLDLWAMYQKKTLPYVRLRSLSDPSMLFSPSFTRIIFVRHPFERLASAYVDKIASLKAESSSIYDKLRRSICRRYASSYLNAIGQHFYRIHGASREQINEPCEKIIPTFEHFASFIMSDLSQDDVHWQPYSTLCSTCTFKYNFVGRYETIEEDLQALRSRLGLNSSSWNVDNHFSTGKTKDYYKSLYSKLPHDFICNLKDFYQEDLKLFHYQSEEYLVDQQKVPCRRQHYRRFRTLT